MDGESQQLHARASDQEPLRFGPCELWTQSGELTIDGRRVHLGARALGLLKLLAENRHRPMSKHELLDRGWPGVVVEENNLQVQISTLRRLLGPQSIVTIPGRGYQFMLGAESEAGAGGELPCTSPVLSGGSGNLPAHLVELYGREGDRAAVMNLMERQALVSIVGSAGIGKTRLALAVAQSSAASAAAWVVELASLSDPRLLAQTIAQTLRLKLPGVREPADELAAALGGENLLLVLDNCEHLIADVCPLVARIARQAGKVRLLVTSQEPLRLSDEHVFRLAPLTVPDRAQVADPMAYGALRLFVERVRASLPRFELTAAHVAAAIEICRRLDGLPLAIELAAARVPLLGIEGVRARLGERLQILTAGSREAPKRHQTLRAALDWSHGLLDADERAVYRRLGVFVGGFSLEGAQLLVAGHGAEGEAVLDRLSSLVDKSLVISEGDYRPRYRMLESTREHALEQLAKAGESEAYLGRHAAVTVRALEQAIRQRRTDLLLSEISNVRSAYEWARAHGDAATAVALATLPSMAIAVEGAVDEACQRLLDAEPLASDPALPKRLEAQYWQWYGRIGLDGRLPSSRCIDALHRAERLFIELGESRHTHACRRHMAEAMLDAGDLDGAAHALGRARAMEHAQWPLADRMRRLRVEGLWLARAGRLDEALRTSTMALEMAQAGNVERYELVLLDDIARMHLEAGDMADAVERYELIAERARSAQNAGLTLSNALAGLIASLVDDLPGEATAVAREALPVLRRSNSFSARADILAHLMASLGHWTLAVRLLGVSNEFRSRCETARDPMELRSQQRAIDLLRGSLGGDVARVIAEIGSTDEERLIADIASAIGA
ncbi:MAG: winged helix-turn-helix domain-containing protein [Proteobacteria bacterium]|nr:winged helix-turn-helix domain-containing protein [Pseudomonadota bacterium]